MAPLQVKGGVKQQEYLSQSDINYTVDTSVYVSLHSCRHRVVNVVTDGKCKV